MNVRVVAAYEDSNCPENGLQAARGMSWYLEFENQRVLFDTGTRGKILTENMGKLMVHPDDIDVLVLSHAHIDHTGGLPEFLRQRQRRDLLPILAHPAVLEPKRAARVINIGCPQLEPELEEIVAFGLTRYPVPINPYLHTTGEITMRNHKDGTGWIMQHKVGGKWEQDPILDDMSLVLETSEGLVLICGCCHAGLLNTLAHVKNIFGKDVIHILGGTHMRSYPKEELEHIAKLLENSYGKPKLSLGHCTGRKQIEWLQDRFGTESVSPIHVGSEFIFTARATLQHTPDVHTSDHA
ncbi:MAG: MBL fold metallo-hydrolase [Candidatus Thorarchaeota archaeon]